MTEEFGKCQTDIDTVEILTIRRIDMEALVAALNFARKLAKTGGFAEILGAEADPGADVQTEAQIKGEWSCLPICVHSDWYLPYADYIKSFVGTEFHTIGSCAMLPQSKGGVVSPDLKVYGTSNIRVVDLSILPIQISAHPQSTVYGMYVRPA